MGKRNKREDEYNQKLILGEVITLIKLSLRLILKEKKDGIYQKC